MDSLTKEQQIELRNKGFLPWEINKFNQGYIRYDSMTFQSMIRSRSLWVKAMREMGWEDKKIAGRIRHWYRIKKKRSPFDWLKIEYRPATKLTIKALAGQLEIRRSASQVFGRAYGRIRSMKVMRRIGFKGLPKPQ